MPMEDESMAIGDDVIPAAERQLYAKGGLGPSDRTAAHRPDRTGGDTL
jgi:hypothetical protein